MLQATIPTPPITLGSTQLPFGQTTTSVAGMSSISTSAATVGGEADANTLHLTPSANSTGVLLAGGSHTGSDATSDFSLSTTLNTSGSPDVFKLAATVTAVGASTKLLNIYGGTSGTTSLASIDTNGLLKVATLALGGASIGSNALAVSGGMNVTNGNIILALTASTAILTNNDNAGLQFIFGGAAFGLGTTGNGVFQASLSTPSTATWHLGTADAASPVAQTLGVQGVVAGTSNTAGANFTIAGSQGTGTGAGGSLIFQVAPAGSTGTSQNALATALTIDSTKLATFSGSVQIGSFSKLLETSNNLLITENGTQSLYITNTSVRMSSNFQFGFTSGLATNILDTFITRPSAGLLSFDTTSSGDHLGSATMNNLTASGSQINFTGLPTSNPHVVGRLWSNSGVLTVSAG
jgi:hypothetical protein